jgi:hypothetical protein
MLLGHKVTGSPVGLSQILALHCAYVSASGVQRAGEFIKKMGLRKGAERMDIGCHGPHKYI